MKDFDIVRLTLATCKDEIDKLLGDGFIENLDEGSPWGRAFIRMNELLLGIEKDEQETL